MRSVPMRAFNSAGVPCATVRAVVEHDDVVGELVGLFEILRRQDDGGAAAHELAQHVPQVVAAARVEPGRRLVEEQHAGVGDEARGEIEPAAHAARERLHQLGRGVGEVEPLEELVGAPARLFLRQVVQAADHHEVLAGAHQPVDRRLLGRDPDAFAHGERVGDHVDARRPSPTPRSAATAW